MSEAQQQRRTPSRGSRRRRSGRRTAPRSRRLAPEEVDRRRALVPPVSYPEELPVSHRRDDIAAAIRDHQVVIVAGETGSGKTTQLPKICLELGRGTAGLIGHTQPRRIAARSVAERIAEEIGRPLGETVGYQVRFTDHSSRDTLVKLMTDGILLAELQHDRDLTAYDTIIIDEAHERSLNVDFLLGYLKRLLPRRPDLKVVITSATIDPQRFSAHFGDAPVVEVSGRTYPVEVRYRPLVEEAGVDDEGETVVRDQTEAVVDAVRELVREGPGDVLVFLPGEREIRDTADVLSSAVDAAGRRVRRGAALRPALLRRAAQGLRAAQPAPGGAGHQRRGDLADRAGHPVRRRRRRRPHLALLHPHQGAAAADRAGEPGLGQPARRPVRPRRGRHLHPALQRGGLPRAAGVHRPGDPAHQPRVGDLADDRARARRRRPLPVRRPARPAQRPGRGAAARGAGRAGSTARRPGGPSPDEARPAAGGAARRPAARPHGDRGGPAGLPARGARHHRGAVAAGPSRAAGGAAGAAPTSCTPGSRTRPRTS